MRLGEIVWWRAGHMEANLPTYPECQKACQIRANSIHTSKEPWVAISYNKEAMLKAVFAKLYHEVNIGTA